MELEIIEVDHSMYPIFKMAVGWGGVGWGVYKPPLNPLECENERVLYILYLIYLLFYVCNFFQIKLILFIILFLFGFYDIYIFQNIWHS